MIPDQKTAAHGSAETFQLLDIFKFVFAILIMCLHGQVFKGSQAGLYFEKIIVRLAVPFFFVSSGFFYGKKVYAGGNLRSITQNYVSRLAGKLLIFAPVAILTKIVCSIVLDHVSVTETLLTAIRHILFYPLGALWYIQAMIVAIILLVPFLKKNREQIALYLGLILYLFALLCNRYFFLCEGTAMEPVIVTYMHFFISARNGLFVGLLYVSMGVLIAKNWTEWKQKDTLLTMLMLASGLGLIVEVCMTNNKTGLDDNALFLAHLVFIPSFFICAGRKTICCTENCLNTRIFRNLSTSIYLLHRPALDLVTYGFRFLFNVSLQPWQTTAMAAMIVAAVCIVVYRKKWNPFYNWIK